MKLSSHEEYGLRCLLQVARHDTGGSATIPEISRVEGISPAYAAKLLRILRQAGLVQAARGKIGGYTLAVPPEHICIGDALEKLGGGRLYEGDFCRKYSGTEACCVHSTSCSMRSLWRSLQDAVDNVLDRLTLRDLMGTAHAGEDDVVFLRSRTNRHQASQDLCATPNLDNHKAIS